MNRKLLAFLVSITLVVAALAGFATRAQADSNKGFGNHNLQGTYMFHADGVVEHDGYVRAMWEVGRFEADGKGNIINGVEHSSLLSSSDPDKINQPFTFTGTYQVNPDGTAKGHVTVIVGPQLTIEKDLWLVIHSVGKDGIANGFAGGHADAEIGGGEHGNSQSHVGWRVELSE
jgi:hypothetical protein